MSVSLQKPLFDLCYALVPGAALPDLGNGAPGTRSDNDTPIRASIQRRKAIRCKQSPREELRERTDAGKTCHEFHDSHEFFLVTGGFVTAVGRPYVVARPGNDNGDSRAATQGRPYETWFFQTF